MTTEDNVLSKLESLKVSGSSSSSISGSCTLNKEAVQYSLYKGAQDLPFMIELYDAELSEPYTVYTYKYFLDTWPHLCFIARVDGAMAGAIVCKLEMHKSGLMRGYIAMLSIKKEYRRKGIGVSLAQLAIEAMKKSGAEEIVLETEEDNQSALSLYSKLGFIREKKIYSFYLNRKSAYRLVLPLV